MASNIRKEIELNVTVKNGKELADLQKNIDKIGEEMISIQNSLRGDTMAKAARTGAEAALRELNIERELLKLRQEAGNLQYAHVKGGTNVQSLLNREQEKYNRLLEKRNALEAKWAEALNAPHAKNPTRVDWARLYNRRTGKNTRELMAARGYAWGDISKLSPEDRAAFYSRLWDTEYREIESQRQNDDWDQRDLQRAFAEGGGLRTWGSIGRMTLERRQTRAYRKYDRDMSTYNANRANIEKYRLENTPESNAKAERLEKENATLASEASKQKAAGDKIGAILANLNVLKKSWQTLVKFAQNTNNLIKETMGINLSAKDIQAGIRSKVGDILNLSKGAATYSAGSSLITNASARNLQLQYGLSGSQAYAFDKTTALLGMQNGDLNENLAYMNEEQRQLFGEMMQKYDTWYTKLEASGTFRSIQEMQLDFAMFKEEMSMEIMKFVADNKDLILGALKAALTIAEWMVQLVGWVSSLGRWFGAGYSEASDTLNSNYNTSKSVSFQQTNYLTGVRDDAGFAEATNDYMSTAAGNTVVALGN